MVMSISTIYTYLPQYLQIAKKATDDTTPRLATVRNTDDVSPRSRIIVDAETKTLADKLKLCEQRNSDYRNQVQGLKNDLKMAQKVGSMSLHVF